MTISTNPTPTLRLARPNFDIAPWHDDVNDNFAKLDAWATATFGAATIDGTWAKSTAYAQGDRIYDSVDPMLYECVVAHTSGAVSFDTDRVAHPSYWVPIAVGVCPRGAWVTTSRYRANDLAFYSGSQYRCLIDHNAGTFATDLAALKWEIFAQQGSAGVGSGDVVGPAGATINRLAIFNNVDGKHINDSGVLLADLATLLSPAFTGSPTAPTQSGFDNTTKIATTAMVQAAIAALVASSPAALDTLNELATALGNDPNFATTMTNALALKAPLASPTLTGTPAAPTAGAGTNTTQLATTAFVTSAVAANSGKTLDAFSPLDNEYPSSNYATFDVRNGHPVLVFADAVVAVAIFSSIMSRRYNGGGLTIILNWMTDGTSTNKVCFSATLERMDVGTTDLDADSFGTQVIDTTGIAANATSGIQSQTVIALTAGAQMDNVVAGDAYRLKITRETGQANDTNASNVQLVSIEIKET